MSRLSLRATIGLTVFGFLLTSTMVLSAQSRAVGRVVDANDGSLIVGATVRLVPSNGSEASQAGTASTDSNGQFDFSSGESGSGLILLVQSPGYAAYRTRLGSSNTPIEIRLERAASATVHVGDSSGSPLPAIISYETFHPGNYMANAVRTDSGVVALTGLASGQTRIVARSEGYAPSAVSVDVAPGERYDPITLTLERAGVLSGVVLDESGMPVTGAQIIASYTTDTSFGPTLGNLFGGRLRTRQDGRFRITNVVPWANVMISVRAGQLGASTSASVAAGEERDDLLVTVR